jgi:hypothetical protein
MRHLLLLLALAPACKWTDFDDLKEEAWVNATERPDNASNNWGIALARSSLASTSGGKLTVLGTAASVYNEIEYLSNGSSKIAGSELELGDLGVANLELQPILLADPTGDGVSIVTKRGPQEVLVLEGTNGMLTGHQVFGADTADAAVYMIAPGIDDGPAQPAQPLVASNDTLFGTFFTPPENPFAQVKCALLDGGTPLQIRALGTVRQLPGQVTDDVVVWAASGKLYVVPGAVFNGARSGPVGGPFVCPDLDADGVGTFEVTTGGPGGGPVVQLDVGFGPDLGSQVLSFGGSFAVLQGHNNQTGASFLGLVSLGDGVAPPALVGNPQTETGLKTAALFERDGAALAVVAGYPNASVDGVDCGKALVYEVDLATGFATTPIEVLHDAQPEDGQSFGRSLAVTPYNNQQIIAVGGNNEVFAYFRTSTLYTDDTRQGR